jgi:hypothetical protein
MPFKKGNHLAGNRKASPNITAQLPSGASCSDLACANQSWFRLTSPTPFGAMIASRLTPAFTI